MIEANVTDDQIAEKVYGIHVGYKDLRPDADGFPRDFHFDLEANVLKHLSERALNSTTISTITNADATRTRIMLALANAQKVLTPEDLLLFSYFGHGSPTQIQIPTRYRSSTNIDMILWKKSDLFAALAQLPGKKIVILSTCYAASSIPTLDNSMVIASSRADQYTWNNQFTTEISHLFIDALNQPQPLTHVMREALTRFHNFPLYNPVTKDRVSQAKSAQMYERELQSGTPESHDWQRSAVQVAMMLKNGTPLQVNPNSNFM